MLQSVFVKKIRYAILKMLLGAKVPNNDTCGLFRAAHSHNPAQYSHIAELSSCFYAHIRAGHKVIEQAHVGLDLLTLVSKNLERSRK